MIEIRLNPSGNLHWQKSPDEMETPQVEALHKAFDRDWRAGLFTLAAEKMIINAAPSLFFWREIGERFLTQLCHLPADASLEALVQPDVTLLEQWTLAAPPMLGGEYLSHDLLLDIWHRLASWCGHASQREQSLQDFLNKRAPKWRQVGRVCFHLAENKANEERPFAFMATYISGLNAGGNARHLPLGKALEQYAGAENRTALINLLSPVLAASERCEWVKALVDSGGIYQPTAWQAQRAYQFLLSVPELEDCGLMVRLPNWWIKRQRPQVSVNIGEKKVSHLGLDSILDFDVSVALGDERLSKAEIKALLSGGEGLVFFKGQWVEVDHEKLKAAITHWGVLRSQSAEGVSFIEGMRLLAGTTTDLKEHRAEEQDREWVHVAAGKALRDILAGLRNPEQLESPSLKQLKATLRPYQKTGAAWLCFLTDLGLGACLADDMGLGKTIQALTLLLHVKQKKSAPSLLVVPASLLGNWRVEAQRFAPTLRLTFLHPAENDAETLKKIEKSPVKGLANTDLAVTTYAMLVRQEWLEKVKWRLVILDEAQAIKNHSTKQARAVKKLSAHARIAMTGTPVENRLGDLWSLFDFVNPGLLGSATVFKTFVGNLQKRNTEQYAPLRRLVSPYILRRLKTDRAIISDLPDKIEMKQPCKLSKEQVRLYEQVVVNMQRALVENKEGIKRKGIVLQTLLRLKQLCNHPSQLTGDGVYDTDASGKFLRIAEICEELAERQERVLVFTQFKEIIEPLAAHLAKIFGRSGLILHGQINVAKRKGLVDVFQQEDGPPFMVLSLKAGGTGLNLTAASHVIHFDRWWNPAVEDQATDRAFRIGQKKNVLVHKFVTTGSIEEKIDLMITEKKQLSNQLLSGEDEMDITSLDDEQLLDLVRLDVHRAAL